MIEFDFSKCGVSDFELGKVQKPELKKAAWMDLPNDEVGVRSIKEISKKIANNFKNLVVLGIGGSSQGLKVLHKIFDKTANNLNLFILESPDAISIRHLLTGLDLSKTCFNVISKSGETVETLALFEFFRPKLKREQIVITTERGEGKLYQLVQKENLHFLEIPKDVPGRFSVFSAVGLFPLACAGVDIDKLLEGARKAELENAFKNGLIHYLLNRDHGKSISIMIPYADCLEEFGKWYVQLWAESLGKEGKGQTPMVAVGPQAQHSLAQLILDGPKDKVVTFIKIESDVHDPFGGLLEKECLATSQALQRRGVPSVTLLLPKLDCQTMGELLMTYQVQTALVGHLMGINPYDQPAVEQIKQLII